MSAIAVEWAYRHQPMITGSDKAVLVYLCWKSDSSGRAWPSVETISKAVGISERSVQGCLRSLEAAGVILTKKRARNTNSYYLQIGKFEVELEPQEIEDAPGNEMGADLAPISLFGVQSASSMGANNVDLPRRSRTQIDNDKQTEKQTNKSAYPQQFEEFWKAYPKKVAKLEAFRQWKFAIQRGAGWDNIVMRAKAYAEDPDRKPDYTLDPERWLKRGRYEDPYPTPKPTKDERGGWSL